MTRIGLCERRLLIGAGFLLVLRLPLFVGHAIDDLARIRIGQGDTLGFGRLAVPAAEAIPAEPRQVHHVDVLHVGPFAQVLDQAAECGCFQLGAGLLVEVGCGHGRPPLLPARWRVRCRFAILPHMTWDDASARAAHRTLFDAAVAAADPRKVLAVHLPPKPSGRCVVVGCGKSAAVMAAALEDAWPDVALEGTVVTRYGHSVPTKRLEVIESSHPVPDANSERGARRLLERVQGLGPEDLVVALISGGGSALCAAPAAGLSLADKQAVNRALLASGANITEMNCVRKHLSAIKGGRLAAAARPARVVTLAISDVPGDDPAVIASGPTVPDPTTFEDARAIVARYGIELPHHVAARLNQDADETPKPGDLPDTDFRLIATPITVLHKVAEAARDLGLTPLILGDALEGEAAQVGILFAGMAHAVATHGQPIAPPAVLLTGGETTVTIGRGPAG